MTRIQSPPRRLFQSYSPVWRISTWLSYATVLVLAATPAWSQDALTPQRSPFLRWLLLLLGFVIIWFIAYKGLYPLFLKYYRPAYCKMLFWSLFLLYSLAWLHLSLYTLFEYGFFFPWMWWVAVFLGTMWLIWFAVVMMTRRA